MAQRIITLCDPHARNDEDVAGSTWSVTLTAPGEAATTWEIDLCEDDSKTLRDLGVMLDAVGRVTQGPRRKVATAARKAARTAGGAIAAPRVTPDGAEAHTCPVEGCDYPGAPSRGTVASHVKRVHGMTLPEAEGQPLTHACPECDFRTSAPQGLAAHRRTVHGVAGSSRASG